MVAQEENMFRRTDCHFAIVRGTFMKSHDAYKDEHSDLLNGKNGKVYLDTAKPRVCIRGQEQIRKENGMTQVIQWYEPLPVDRVFPFYELRAAAVDLRPTEKNPTKTYDHKETEKRVAAQLETLISENVRHVVLSAFGCGAFENPADRVASAYHEALRTRHKYFDVVAFAIFNAGYGPHNFAPFKKEFAKWSMMVPEPAPNGSPEIQTYKEESFELADIAGGGGTKRVYYIGVNFGDWVLALPNELDEVRTYWPRIVKEELLLSAELGALGIPCLEMYGVMSRTSWTKRREPVPALKMRSFAYYLNAHRAVIMDRKNGSYFSYPDRDGWSELIGGRADTWLKRGVKNAVTRLVKLLTPLANDIRNLAQNCTFLDPSGESRDALNWQVVFDDKNLEYPSEIRVFIFDLSSKHYVRRSILAKKGETDTVKAHKAYSYLDFYLAYILPRGEKYSKLNEATKVRMKALVTAPRSPVSM
jgi:hypothetical protein